MSKTQRARCVASLVIGVCVILFTASAFFYNFRTDVIRDEVWFGYTGWKCLRFFTTLSNLYAALAAAVTAVFAARNLINDEYRFPFWAIAFKYSATVCVSVTFLTVTLFLAPMTAANGNGYFLLFAGNNFYMHFLTPVLCIVSFLFLERAAKELPFRATLAGLLPVILYAAVYAVMVVGVGEARGGWVDFYGLTFGGNTAAIPFSALAMCAAAFGISAALWALHRRRAQKPL